MIETELISCALLGGGRSRPGLWILRPGDGEPTRIANLELGQSVYAIDVDADAGLIVLGTRSGSIKVLPVREESAGPGQQEHVTLSQNAPLLAVCFAGKDRVVGADAAGRCLLWNPLDRSNGATPLEVKGGTVCSVLPLTQESVIGLSTDGKLLIWDVRTGTLTRVVDAHKPCKKHALVRLRHWAARNAIVYASSEGDLVVWEIDSQQANLLPAHSGEFYVIMAAGDRLYTIGRNDGLLKVWDPTATNCCRQIGAPKGVAAGDILPDHTDKMLLVNDEGQAAIYEINANSLRVLRRFAGDSYRSVYCSSQEARRAFEQRWRVTRGEQLQEQIRAKIDAGECEALEEFYQELITLGFELVALALRARQAAKEHDDLGTLGAIHALVTGLPHEEKTRSSWLHRYAQVLESLWCLEEARAAQREAGVGQAVSHWLDEAARVIAADNWIAEPDAPLPALIEAATIIGTPFRGRWVLAVSAQLKYDAGTLTPQTLTAAYKEVRRKRVSAGALPARIESPWWISRASVQEVGTILLGDTARQAVPGIRPAVQIRNEAHHIVAMPVILLETGRPTDDIDVEEHNQRVLSVCEEVSHLEPDDLWPRATYHDMIQALRALNTKARRDRRL